MKYSKINLVEIELEQLSVIYVGINSRRTVHRHYHVHTVYFEEQVYTHSLRLNCAVVCICDVSVQWVM